MRKIKAFEQGKQKAIVYFDSEWQEYITRHFLDGEYLGEDADNHTDDKDDALATAQSEVARVWNAPAPSELVQSFDAELLADTMEGAIDSVTVWADVSSTTRKNGALKSFVATDSEDSDVSKLITIETIARGFRAILDDEESCCESIRKTVIQAVAEKDACYMDAYGFDAVAQIGAFGDIVYG